MQPALTSIDGEILSPRATVRVVGRRHPLSGSRVDRDLPAGLSIAEILAECAGDAYAGGFVVHIDGHPIIAENFRRIRVKRGATVTFVPRLQGGANVWRTIGTLVVAVAAVVLAVPTGGLSLGLAAATGLSAGVASALISTGIILAGTLALNALFPVRPAQLSNDAGSTSLNSIQGAQNQSNPFGSVPVVLGRHRQSPYYAAKPYTEIVGDDQYLRLLFCLGYGPLLIEDIQIGETPLSSYTDVEIEIRQGFAGDAPVTLYPAQVDEVALSIQLDNTVDAAGAYGSGGDWHVQVTSPGTNEISIDITASQGCYRINKQTGALDGYGVDINVQYRALGAASWASRPIIAFGRSVNAARKGDVWTVSPGQYEVRVQKGNGNGDPTEVKDIVVWTALRSIKQMSPLAFPKPLALIALRIKATDQLSGVISTLNCVTTSLVNAYTGSGSIWTANTASQNPADLFRHVLQGPANARPRGDAQIDLAGLQDWWTNCVAKGFKFNQVLNATGSVYDKLCDIAAAGRAVPAFIDGKWGVVWDRPSDPIVQHFTPRNSWGFQLQRPYAQQPHGWRVTFINEANGFTQDERIVYDDGYDATNATLFEGLQFPGVTDPDLIWKHGRFHIAQSRLRPEKLSLNVGWEHLVATRGDRVRVTHDAMLIGLVSARVKTVAGQVVTFDEIVTIEAGKTYGVTFRVVDATRSIERAVDASMGAGDYTALTLVGDLSLVEAGNLCAFGETGQETADYRIQGVAHQKNLVATLTLVDDAPGISAADSGAIPAYNPNVTIPADPFTLPPRDLRYLEVIDGAGTGARALVRLTWQVPRFGNVLSFEIQQRDDGAGGDFVTVESVTAPSTSADVGLAAAGVWSFRVRCRFDNGTVSSWTSLIGLNLSALSSAPSDVTNLHARIIDGQTVLDWTIVDDPRVLFYELRKGTSWDTGLVVGDAVAQPPFPTTGDGTYFIRAYVLSPFGVRIYSANAVSITIAGAIVSRNIIESIDEQVGGWTGGLDGGVIDGSFIRTDPAHAISQTWSSALVEQLALSGVHIAVYLSQQIVDIGQPAECRFWTLFEASGILQGDDFLAQADVLGAGDILGTSPTRFIRAFPVWRFAAGANDIFGPADVFALPDAYLDAIPWSDWTAIASGTRIARFFQPGFVLITDRADTNAVGTKFSWFVDVPDRTDDYTELTVPNTGLSVTFYPGGFDGAPAPGTSALPFNGGPNGSTVPHVQRAIVNATNGDEVKITGLTLAGCTVNVVNAGSNVTRSGVNLLVRGY